MFFVVFSFVFSLIFEDRFCVSFWVDFSPGGAESPISSAFTFQQENQQQFKKSKFISEESLGLVDSEHAWPGWGGAGVRNGEGHRNQHSTCHSNAFKYAQNSVLLFCDSLEHA